MHLLRQLAHVLKSYQFFFHHDSIAQGSEHGCRAPE
jgi:hypothetical protein